MILLYLLGAGVTLLLMFVCCYISQDYKSTDVTIKDLTQGVLLCLCAWWFFLPLNVFYLARYVGTGNSRALLHD